MFVGENDSGWREASRQPLQTLTSLGGRATWKVMPGEGHILNVTGAQLFDALEIHRAGK